ncbi:hypothetical protein BTW15_23390 [Pseudomonas syringae pv. tomato]|uniref:Lipoprotein n=1 Tax=Pseudomonas syringae pv. tomato TaxID=323 RepID=A0AB36KRL3_PSEUB|nr:MULTISPECIES: hypothetical protein [Pseudomonas]OPE57630.1 hypothetical protein BTW15_23390 [Pseudomonas syringae pv. tomato]PYD04503.1 hypothetical protein DND90_09880 [Pseudomonas syringae pv. maculicola]RMM15875.1 hypothetical protein ALQ85_200065 [Pseudomonas syringae]TES55912.1 hypothetical protein E2N91_19925 [Pseudomonas syringae pv. tomato]TES74276.1 hypothetical protein E2N89_24640 [Pseudomonas syringae pv. tomato]
MKMSSTRIKFFLAYIIMACSLWTASEWWEKALAKRSGVPLVSPGGCYRLEAFKPFWVLPDILHREPDPNGVRSPKWFPWWGSPGFYRLYDHRNGKLISETEIYDRESGAWGMDWGEGSGFVYSGLIPIGPNVPDCMRDRPAQQKAQ